MIVLVMRRYRRQATGMAASHIAICRVYAVEVISLK